MSTALVEADSASWGLWLVPKDESKVPDNLMGEALILIAAAQGRPIDEAGVIAYRMALADVEPEDFREGLRKAFRAVKFFTPAAVREYCDEARVMRLHAIEDARQREEYEKNQALEAEDKRQRQEKEDRLAALIAAGERGPALELALRLRRSFMFASAEFKVLSFDENRRVRIDGYFSYRHDRAVEEVALEVLGERIANIEYVREATA